MGLAITCIGLLGFLVVALGMGVVAQRASTKTSIGFKDDPADPLYKWVRAHANACEYAPMLAVLIYVLASTGYSGWHGWLYIGAVVARYLHAAGMVLSPTLAKPNPLRFVGAVGTFFVGTVLAISAIF